MAFYLIFKKFGNKYGKEFVKKRVSAAKRFKTAPKMFNKSKYGKT